MFLSVVELGNLDQQEHTLAQVVQANPHTVAAVAHFLDTDSSCKVPSASKSQKHAINNRTILLILLLLQ